MVCESLLLTLFSVQRWRRLVSEIRSLCPDERYTATDLDEGRDIPINLDQLLSLDKVGHVSLSVGSPDEKPGAGSLLGTTRYERPSELPASDTTAVVDRHEAVNERQSVAM